MFYCHSLSLHLLDTELQCDFCPRVVMLTFCRLSVIGLCSNESYMLVHTRFISDVCQMDTGMQCRMGGDKNWVVTVFKPGSCSPFLCACSIHDRKYKKSVVTSLSLLGICLRIVLE